MLAPLTGWPLPSLTVPEIRVCADSHPLNRIRPRNKATLLTEGPVRLLRNALAEISLRASVYSCQKLGSVVVEGWGMAAAGPSPMFCSVVFVKALRCISHKFIAKVK